MSPAVSFSLEKGTSTKQGVIAVHAAPDGARYQRTKQFLLEMKKLLLTGVAVLLLATGTAHADSEKWEASFRQCHIRKWFSKDELANIGWARETEGQTIVIEAEEIPDILNAIRVIKKCKAFYQCLEDRNRGKVKHCYENDRRWR